MRVGITHIFRIRILLEAGHEAFVWFLVHFYAWLLAGVTGLLNVLHWNVLVRGLHIFELLGLQISKNNWRHRSCHRWYNGKVHLRVEGSEHFWSTSYETAAVVLWLVAIKHVINWQPTLYLYFSCVPPLSFNINSGFTMLPLVRRRVDSVSILKLSFHSLWRFIDVERPKLNVLGPLCDFMSVRVLTSEFREYFLYLVHIARILTIIVSRFPHYVYFTHNHHVSTVCDLAGWCFPRHSLVRTKLSCLDLTKAVTPDNVFFNIFFFIETAIIAGSLLNPSSSLLLFNGGVRVGMDMPWLNGPRFWVLGLELLGLDLGLDVVRVHSG